jgi:hypothetical protein
MNSLIAKKICGGRRWAWALPEPKIPAEPIKNTIEIRVSNKLLVDLNISSLFPPQISSCEIALRLFGPIRKEGRPNELISLYHKKGRSYKVCSEID